MPAKVITEILDKYATAPKSNMQALEDHELSIVFEHLTQNNQISNIAAIYADEPKKPEAPKVEAPKAEAPKAQPAAPSAPWESEQVPYDDVMVGGFAADAGGDDLPPFDVPGAASAPKPAATAPKEEDAPAAPWESNPGAGSPFGHQGAAPSIPQTEDEAKALIRSVFGQSTIFKPVE